MKLGKGDKSFAQWPHFAKFSFECQDQTGCAAQRKNQASARGGTREKNPDFSMLWHFIDFFHIIDLTQYFDDHPKIIPTSFRGTFR